MLPRTAEHPGAPALRARCFAKEGHSGRLLIYLQRSLRWAQRALSTSQGRSMLQGAPAPRTHWWKEVTGRRITMGHLYTIYMQDKLIHDRQPGRSGALGGTLQAGERRARLGCASSSPLRPGWRGAQSWVGVLMPSCAVLWLSSHGRAAPGCLLTAIGNMLPCQSSLRGYFG